MRGVNAPAWLKLSLTLGIAALILLMSYQLIVRHSFIGTMLNGKRAPQVGRDKAALRAPAGIADPEQKV